MRQQHATMVAMVPGAFVAISIDCNHVYLKTLFLALYFILGTVVNQ